MKNLYEAGRKQLKKDIKDFFKEQEDSLSDFNELFDEDTIQGYANRLLSRALNLLD